MTRWQLWIPFLKSLVWPDWESNPVCQLRRRGCYPLHHRAGLSPSSWLNCCSLVLHILTTFCWFTMNNNKLMNRTFCFYLCSLSALLCNAYQTKTQGNNSLVVKQNQWLMKPFVVFIPNIIPLFGNSICSVSWRVCLLQCIRLWQLLAWGCSEYLWFLNCF